MKVKTLLPVVAVSVILPVTLVSIVRSLAADIGLISTAPAEVLYAIYMPFRWALESWTRSAPL